MDSETMLARAMQHKEAGNSHFKHGQYPDAIECYSQALTVCPQDHDCRAIFLKNRAACYLKLKQFSSALSDCTQSLNITPNDVKTLYRRASSYEGSGYLTDAFADLKLLLSIEPQNRDAVELARRVTTAIKKQHDILQSTDGIIKEMFQALSDPGVSQTKATMAAKNCAILSQERAGAEKIYQAGGVAVLLPLLDTGSPEVVRHVLQTFVGLCTGHKARAHAVIQRISLEKLSMLISHEKSEVSCSAVAVVKQAILSVSSDDTVTPRGAESAMVVTADTAVIIPVVQMVFILLLNRSITSETRDHIMEMLMATIPKNNFVISVYLKGGLVSKLLQLSAVAEREEDNVAVSEECRANISVVLSTLHNNCTDKEKTAMEEECVAFVFTRLDKNETSAKRDGIIGIATLLQGVLEIGAKIFIKKSAIEEVLKMADSDDIRCQSVAAEALALAASNKERCHDIIKDGLPVLKKLFKSADDGVKVRALVGLCKLGCVGGSNVNARTFSEGSGLKLEQACRKFLTKKRGRLYKWAIEGLAFLSLDAEVKEVLITNNSVMTVLCSTPKTGEQSLFYGLATIFVNLTNSYDKPEKNPELEELGKYAGENVPKEHELDAEEYVKKRVSSLLGHGIVPSLVTLSGVESTAIHEQVARVFLALVAEPSNRGLVLQQGGVKALLSLTDNNTICGKQIAAQALAKIGITNDPKLAFQGQRSLEVIRPLVQLLKSEQGLQQFEALMALTNLAGTTDDVRQRIIKEGGIPLMESLMFEENDLIRRAATEALCNMIQMPEVHERFLRDDVERVKLWTLFSGEEDFELARAASGGLAQLTLDPCICHKVMEVKSANAILKELIANEKEELQHRGTYILANIVAASRDLAQDIISSDFLEVLMALVLTPTTSQSVKSSASRALEKAVEYKLIEPNPQLYA